LKEEEEQYQRLRQEEVLFRIGEELTALLEAERGALAALREVDGSRDAEKLSRAERLRLRRISGELVQHATRTGEIATAIEAESAAVFAHVLREVRQDLERVSSDIDEVGGHQTGERPQALLEDAIEATERVLEALKSEQQRRQQEQQQQQQQQQQEGQQQSKQALVPDVAELRLLRLMEVDTLDALRRFETLYPDLKPEDAGPEVLEDLLRLAERHERTTRLFARFRARLGIDGPTAPGVQKP
jgi:alpha-ketoglutarate-dependent taurine dioxygenase